MTKEKSHKRRVRERMSKPVRDTGLRGAMCLGGATLSGASRRDRGREVEPLER